MQLEPNHMQDNVFTPIHEVMNGLPDDVKAKPLVFLDSPLANKFDAFISEVDKASDPKAVMEFRDITFDRMNDFVTTLTSDTFAKDLTPEQKEKIGQSIQALRTAVDDYMTRFDEYVPKHVEVLDELIEKSRAEGSESGLKFHMSRKDAFEKNATEIKDKMQALRDNMDKALQEKFPELAQAEGKEANPAEKQAKEAELSLDEQIKKWHHINDEQWKNKDKQENQYLAHHDQIAKTLSELLKNDDALRAVDEKTVKSLEEFHGNIQDEIAYTQSLITLAQQQVEGAVDGRQRALKQQLLDTYQARLDSLTAVDTQLQAFEEARAAQAAGTKEQVDNVDPLAETKSQAGDGAGGNNASGAQGEETVSAETSSDKGLGLNATQQEKEPELDPLAMDPSRLKQDFISRATAQNLSLNEALEEFKGLDKDSLNPQTLTEAVQKSSQHKMDRVNQTANNDMESHRETQQKMGIESASKQGFMGISPDILKGAVSQILVASASQSGILDGNQNNVSLSQIPGGKQQSIGKADTFNPGSFA